jgi:hypothetical protein
MMWVLSIASTFMRYELKTPAIQWRQEIARRTVVLLRTVVSVLGMSVATWHGRLVFLY